MKTLHCFWVAACLACAPSASLAAQDQASLCESAARQASAATGVPLDVLNAIMLAESGRSSRGAFRPWPWAVNFGGAGTWYESRNEAQHAASERQAQGSTNFDIGCFQINYRWHAGEFNTLADMFDPVRNADYAARFLLRLFRETGSWPKAAAAYHSRSPELAERYRARFEDLREGVVVGGPPILVAARHENLFPLLKSGGRGAPGSLVPRQTGGRRLLGPTR